MLVFARTWKDQPVVARVNYARNYAGENKISPNYSLSTLEITAEMLKPEGLLGIKPWVVATILEDMYKRISRRKRSKQSIQVGYLHILTSSSDA